MEHEEVKKDFREINEFSEFEAPKIYSTKAIWGFSVIFSPIFGGFLLMQNLKDTNRKHEANLVLFSAFGLTLLTFAIVTYSNIQIPNLAFLCNMIGGGVLSYYFQKKYFPNEDKFEKKKIWKALIISIVITIPFIVAMIYSMQ